MNNKMSIDKNIISGAVAHGIMRTISVVLVMAALVGPSWYFYNRGYKIGYSRAIKEHPQVVVQGNNNYVDQTVKAKEPFFIFKLWFLRLSSSESGKVQ